MRRLLLPAAVLLLLLTSQVWADAKKSEPASPLTTGIQRVTLKNGLRLILAPDPAAAAADLAVWYDAGSRHDRPGKTGLAHLFEHLMFRGSAHFPAEEHARLVRAEGGTLGAFATPDFTCFYETLPPDALELAFRLEADRMTDLTITQASLDIERRNVASERARRVTLQGRGLEKIYALAYPSHPYGWPIYGLSVDLPKLTLADAQSFYRAHFGPARTVVTVVGRFDPERAQALARKYFEPLKTTGARETADLAKEKAQTAERRATDIAGAPVRALMAGWRLPPRGDPRWPALDVLSVLLAHGTSARLSRALVLEHPLCPSVQSDIDSHRDESLFYVSAPLLQEADSSEVEQRLFAEIGRLASDPVGDDELERAKRQIETATLLSLQTSRGRAQAIGHSLELAGDERDFALQLDKIRAVSAQDLMQAAQLLSPSSREVVWIVSGAPSGGRP